MVTKLHSGIARLAYERVAEAKGRTEPEARPSLNLVLRQLGHRHIRLDYGAQGTPRGPNSTDVEVKRSPAFALISPEE